MLDDKYINEMFDNIGIFPTPMQAMFYSSIKLFLSYTRHINKLGT